MTIPAAFVPVAMVAAARRASQPAEARPPLALGPAALLVHAPSMPSRPARVANPHADLPSRLKARATRVDLPVRTRTIPLAPPPAVAAAARRVPDEPVAASAARPAWTPSVPAPAIDVDALTSHVMQQLDRRLVAYRERMGRV
jgi:hypothetical protein